MHHQHGGMTGHGQETTAPGGITPVVVSEKSFTEEFHDPFDDWSSRDLLLALSPFIIAYAFQDAHFRAGLLVALCASVGLLIMRTIPWDSRKKTVWPMFEITGIVLFAILYGLSYRHGYQINKWFNVIVPGTLAVVGLISMAIRRPFTAHYARYPKHDIGGCNLWARSSSWRKTADMAMLIWTGAFITMLALSLIPILTGRHFGGRALNIIFNYIVPGICALTALLATQMLGHQYRSKAPGSDDAARAGYPTIAGAPAGTGMPGSAPTTAGRHGVQEV